jgi:hypothetical protein
MNTPAVMTLAAGRLALATDAGVLCDAALPEVKDIKFPWYYFGGGVKLTIAKTRYRISFVRPNGAEDVSDRLLAGANLGAASLVAAADELQRKYRDISSGREAGRVWRAALTGAS